ncbi:glycosyltransferase [Allomesorhizobium camelthorni]|uniref:Glycosyltransferase n=1 Tax=Allomesorhizobium camelthorni TaxID=475069 RepID=A0A6G4WJ68_9HYPH|nr:glycosyltransferase [Mesorhizobium camelthorni]NGO54127.1 glycosyltransferase [Mesorhizobium camelthorni]
MHLLFATSIVPDGGLGSGYEIANAAIIAALRRAGVRVTVVGFTWPGRTALDAENTIVLGAVDVRNEHASIVQKLKWLAKAALTGLTFSSVKLRLVSPEQVRRAIAEAGPFDGYLLNSVQFAGAFESVFDDRPSIFIAHNVEHVSAAENANAARGGFERLLFLREARLLKRLEARLCGSARFVFTLAEEDRSALGVASDAKSAALPLVTRPDAPSPSAARRSECDAALIGTWTWQPNRVGLDWFLGEVVPHLRRDFRTSIAGSVPAGVTCSHPGVTFVGRVSDAQDFVRSAAVVSLISRAGTGVQLKTIEAFELGLPTVATSSSLRGVGHVPANCVVADDPATFAAALERAASGEVADADGAAFYRRQREELDARVRRGLEALGYQRHEALA